MKGFLKKLVTRVAKGQGGFTLIEMIVVVGIIAVLAAVIVPNIGKFIGSGEQGAQDAEQESVQTAMNAMMAENSISTVTACCPAATAVQDWTSKPEGTNAEPLTGYLQLASGSTETTYWYCYNADGIVTEQQNASFTCQ